MKVKILFLVLVFMFVIAAGYSFASAEDTLPLDIKKLIKEKKYIEAEKEAVKLEKNGDLFLSNLAYGEILLARGEINKAEEHFKKVREINPSGIEGKIGIAKILAARKDVEKARQILMDALKTSPHPVRIFYELGLILESSGNIKGATDAFEKGLERYFFKR